jgi:RasGEF domain
MKMIQHFNKVSNWVVTEIVKLVTIKERAAMLTRFIDLAAVRLTAYYGSIVYP